MIKVIKHGSKKVTKCDECDCIFRYEKEDEVTEKVHINEYRTYVICPDCETKVVIGI